MTKVTPHRPAPVPAVILAGGRSSRMGGGDKGLRRIGDRTLIDHVLTRLASQVDALAINANGDPSRFAPFGLPVLADDIRGFAGPLAGILAALDWAAAAGNDRVLTVPADTPFLPGDLVRRLLARETLPVIAATDHPDTPRTHPTVGLWPVTLRDDLRATLASGEHRVGTWAARAGAAMAVFPAGPPDPFFNVNTPEDLAQAAALLDGVAR